MKHLLILILLIQRLLYSVCAQGELFEKQIYSEDGFEMPYRLHIPKMDTVKKLYPLVLYLHGAGERGNDNEKSLKNGVLNFISQENTCYDPAFIFVPQCPENYRWVEVDWGLPAHSMPDSISVPLHHTMELLRKIIEQYSVDTNRIYVTGLSMGGFGTWDLICRYPDMFAAAVPVCGGGDIAKAPLIVNVPIWAFHGRQDNIVPLHRSVDIVQAVNNHGGCARLTIYNSVAHNAWVRAYSDKKMISWLFSQSKQNVFNEE